MSSNFSSLGVNVSMGSPIDGKDCTCYNFKKYSAYSKCINVVLNDSKSKNLEVLNSHYIYFTYQKVKTIRWISGKISSFFS